MRGSHLPALLLGAGLLTLPGGLRSAGAPVPAPRSEGAKIELKDVKYADLGKAVKAQRGKVVVVELWANY